jgi:hypothetical protein
VLLAIVCQSSPKFWPRIGEALEKLACDVHYIADSHSGQLPRSETELYRHQKRELRPVGVTA